MNVSYKNATNSSSFGHEKIKEKRKNSLKFIDSKNSSKKV